jgi:outer membrane protein TolC
MSRLSFSRAFVTVAVAAGFVSACTALGPAGNGGWDEAARRRELARASALLSPPVTKVVEAPEAPPPAPRFLDLAEALDLASRRNRAIAVSSASLDAAAGDVAAVRAALLPSVAARGSYNWYSDEQTNSIDIDPSLFPPGTALPVVTVRQRDFANVSAAARLALDLSGELRHGLGAAQASYRAEKARAWATQLGEERRVAAAFYGLLEAERLREVGRRTLDLHERQLADASSRFDQGRLTRNGVLVVQVAVTDARQALMRLDNAVGGARRELNAATGLAIGDATSVRDVAGRPSLPSLDDAVAALATRNPVVTGLLEEVHAADERLTAARRSRFPRFSASAGYDATTADLLQPNNYASAGIGVELDLVNLRREGEIVRLDAAARRARLLLDRTVRDLEQLVRDSHDRLRERLAAIDTAREAVGQAEENLRIRQVQFDEGRATSEDLLEASQLLTRQRAAQAAALYQAHARRAELQQLMGEPLSALADDAPAPPGESSR